jgi:hypothetical protein
MGDVIKFRPKGPVRMAFTRHPVVQSEPTWSALSAIFAVCSAGLLISAFWSV